MASPARSRLSSRFGFAAATAGFLGLAGCQLGGEDASTLLPSAGTVAIKGLEQNVSIRRNPQGMALIESHSFHDALFSLGYLHAGERVGQMLGMRLLAQGRLAEVVGAEALPVDRLMRAANLKRSASELYKGSSPRLQKFFEVYARGVNAYLFRYRDKLPGDLASAGYRLEYWQPEDSALIFSLLSFNLSVNLQQELSALVLNQKVGADKLAWLLPSAPDEAIAFAEADKLKGLSLAGQGKELNDLNRVALQLADLNLLGNAASSNWAIAPLRSRSGKSLLVSELQVPSGAASGWSLVQINAPKYQASGVTIAGLPLFLSGFNGKLAWSMGNLKGDNQDLFLEKLKRENNRLMYLADGKWQPAVSHQETFMVKGSQPVRETVYSTRHGTLLQAGESASALGVALQIPDFKDDKSLDALFNLSRANNVERGFDASREIRAIGLNMVFADASNVAWQVTGRYPNRRDGQGLLPSPGWDSRYDWDGFADAMLHPYDQDPRQGWLGTANNRVAPKGYGMQLSNTWGYPERAERLAELANAGKQDLRSSIAAQYDQRTLFAAKLKAMFEAPGMAKPLKQAIEALPDAERGKAREAYSRLMAFDGNLTAGSADAAIYQLFLQESARLTFQDELGGADSPAWQALVANARSSWSAQADHLLGRDDSPFWDDLKTPQKEDKPAILARSLAAAISAGESQLGSDRKAWQWGKLHRYDWAPSRNPLARHLGGEGQFQRSPVPAGGDHSSLNPAAYAWGQSFDVLPSASLRMVVDFSQAEPLQAVVSSGQSGNPASPFYANSIDAWLKAQYSILPVQQQNYERGYGKQRLTLTPGK